MTPEIKNKIEQIRRGNVPEGYKRTKAGIVPMEWEEKRIGDVLTQRKTLMCISEDMQLLSFDLLLHFQIALYEAQNCPLYHF